MYDARKHPNLLALSLLVFGLALAAPALAKNGGQEAQVNAALAAMAAGPNTVAGPGAYEAGRDGDRLIFDVGSATPQDVCITLRNRGNNGRIKIEVAGEPEEESLRPGLTVSRCFAAPSQIRLKCGGNGSCEGVWRIDRF